MDKETIGIKNIAKHEGHVFKLGRNEEGGLTMWCVTCEDEPVAVWGGEEADVPETEQDELAEGIGLILLAEWVAIQDGKTRNEALEYTEKAQELADYLHAIGYRY